MNKEILTFKEENKQIITGECRHNYTYYEYTPEIIQKIVNKHPNDLSNDEWRTLIQMLYPDSLICSGLIQPILLFHIKDKYRVDPPYLAFNSIVDKNKKINCTLYEKIYNFLLENEVVMQSGWKEVLETIKKE